MIEVAPKNGYCPCLCPYGEPQFPPPLLGDTPKPAGLTQAPVKLLAFALGPGACGILCAHLRTGVSVSPSPWGS